MRKRYPIVPGIVLALAVAGVTGCESDESLYGVNSYTMEEEVVVPTETAALEAADQEITEENFDDEFKKLEKELEEDETP